MEKTSELSLARIGIMALVDEATGYQEVRPKTELHDKLKQLEAVDAEEKDDET